MQRLFKDNPLAIQQQFIDYSMTIQRQRAMAVMRRSFLCGMVSATSF